MNQTSSKQPNILILMTDQMQGRVLEAGHPCQTPHLDRLAQRGVRVSRAYTPNPVCSPARASMMTGRLPHSHGVLTVTHCVDEDQACLREDLPHFAQQLEQAGYVTSLWGKSHIERSNDLARFGWTHSAVNGSPAYRACADSLRDAGADDEPASDAGLTLHQTVTGPPGYRPGLLYATTDVPAQQRGMGVSTELGLAFLQEQLDRPATQRQPWCCMVSITEPHDPFVTHSEALAAYDIDALTLPENFTDDLANRPGLYRKSARAYVDLTDRQKREAMACYYASITEIDSQFGRLLDALEAAGELDDTVIVLTSDHGELLGAHGLYLKNVGAFEETYTIPMLLAGPGVAKGQVADARVGLHDLAPTLLDLAGVAPMDTAGESRSFAPLLADPKAYAADFQTGYAEYFGTRYWLTQRVIWDGPWKLVWNGFDFDELYHLDEDPGELHNRIDDPACEAVVDRLMRQAYRIIRDTDDASLWNAQYPALRLAPRGPEILVDP